MTFVAENYGKHYAPNTRETFRRQVLHQFVQGRITDYNPDEPDLPVNSPKVHYAISNEALSVIKTYNTRKWKSAVKTFISNIGTLTQEYEKERSIDLIPVTLEGKEIKLSAGKHNEVQATLIWLDGNKSAQSSLKVGCKKLEVNIKKTRSDFVVNVLRTTQFIHRIHSIDIVSLREITAIARRAFMSIENEPPPHTIARRA